MTHPHHPHAWRAPARRALAALALLGALGLGLLGGAGWVFGSLSAAWRVWSGAPGASGGVLASVLFAALMLGGMGALARHARRAARTCAREAARTHRLITRRAHPAPDTLRGALHVSVAGDGGLLSCADQGGALSSADDTLRSAPEDVNMAGAHERLFCTEHRS